MTAARFRSPQRKRPDGESVESPTAGEAVPDRPCGSGQTSRPGRATLRAPSSSPRPALGPDRPSLHPAGSYLQAIGRRGAETAPAARGFRLSPHPRAAAPPAAVRAAALLGGSLAPGPAAPFRAPAGSLSAASRPRGAVDWPRRGGAERGVGQACGAGTKHRGSGERAGGCGLRL